MNSRFARHTLRGGAINHYEFRPHTFNHDLYVDLHSYRNQLIEEVYFWFFVDINHREHPLTAQMQQNALHALRAMTTAQIARIREMHAPQARAAVSRISRRPLSDFWV